MRGLGIEARRAVQEGVRQGLSPKYVEQEMTMLKLTLTTDTNSSHPKGPKP